MKKQKKSTKEHDGVKSEYKEACGGNERTKKKAVGEQMQEEIDRAEGKRR